MTRSRADGVVPGLPPRFLTKEQAAAYVGVSPNVFEQEVAKGMWPSPLRRGDRGGRLTWDRILLDASADRASGLSPVVVGAPLNPSPGTPTLPDPVAAAEAEALERSRGPTQGKRHQASPAAAG